MSEFRIDPWPSIYRAVKGMFARADRQRIRGECFAVLQRGGRTIQVIGGPNLVTDAGDVHVAQQWAQESPANAFGIWELGTAGDAPAKGSNRSNVTAKVTGSQKAHDATYPRTNDPDGDNPGTVGLDIVTFRVSYTTGEANASDIDRAIITNISPGASEPVMAYKVFAAPFSKTPADTLKLFWNFALNGT